MITNLLHPELDLCNGDDNIRVLTQQENCPDLVSKAAANGMNNDDLPFFASVTAETFANKCMHQMKEDSYINRISDAEHTVPQIIVDDEVTVTDSVKQSSNAKETPFRILPFTQSSLRHLGASGGQSRLVRKDTCKLSRKLTRKMSRRQKHALMMEGEFDEFDDITIVPVNEEDELLSPQTSDDEHDKDSIISEDSDVEFEEKIAVQLNLKRLEVFIKNVS